MIRDFFAEMLYPQWDAQSRQRLSRVGETSEQHEAPEILPDNALGDAILSKERTDREHIVNHAASSYWKNELEFAQALKLNEAEAQAEEPCEAQASTPEHWTHEDVVTEMLLRSAKGRADFHYSETFAPPQEDAEFDWIGFDDADDQETRITMASNPSCPIAVLELLACDTNERVARIAAYNLRTQLGRAV
ncbi:MAG TPA: hypothetical protein V6C81_21770 [Planktothrix sp.]|jgi:hypothetical protein